MAVPNIGEGMGKKIVEALKMQSAGMMEEDTTEIEAPVEIEDNTVVEEEAVGENIYEESMPSYEQPEMSFSQPITTDFSQSFIDNAFQQSLEQNMGVSSYPTNVENSANVTILKQLIAKLPAGVSKQTGAVIIKQTMEALGISMNGVLQEARQTRDSLINSAKECQSNVVEYRKQIALMEAKAQQYQKESGMLNDIINLFLQTGIR